MATQKVETPIAPEPALLFIPDISGFTRFVTQTENIHAQHIISELLEILLETNVLGMEVSEIEGDAILFFRFGKAPTLGELTDQIRQMFLAFHAHLKQYEQQRICQCGACSTAHQLTLKFVTHFGEIALNPVHGRDQLFGKEVIVAHRLLKNDIEYHEYALFTDDLLGSASDWEEDKKQKDLLWKQSCQQYDSGTVYYHHFHLKPFHEQVPAPIPQHFRQNKRRVEVLQKEIAIQAPLETVFSAVVDLPFRSKWNVALKREVDELNSRITRNGSSHRCLINDPVTISHNYQKQADKVTYWETETSQRISTAYTFAAEGSGKTIVSQNIFLRDQWFLKLFFRLFLRRKFQKQVDQSWEILRQHCEELAQKGELHHNAILL